MMEMDQLRDELRLAFRENWKNLERRRVGHVVRDGSDLRIYCNSTSYVLLYHPVRHFVIQHCPNAAREAFSPKLLIITASNELPLY